MGQREEIQALLLSLPISWQKRIEQAGLAYRRKKPIDAAALWAKVFEEWAAEGQEGRARKERERMAELKRLVEKLENGGGE